MGIRALSPKRRVLFSKCQHPSAWEEEAFHMLVGPPPYLTPLFLGRIPLSVFYGFIDLLRVTQWSQEQHKIWGKKLKKNRRIL